MIEALIFGLSRAAHGGGYVSRFVSVLIMAIAYGVHLAFAGHSLLDVAVASVIALGGLWVGLLFGWGAFFSSFTGNVESTKEKEFGPGEWFADVLQPLVETPADARRWGVTGMCVRFTMFAPLFILLALWLGDYWLLAWGAGAIVFSGFVYGALRYSHALVEKHGTRAAEFVTLFLIGLAVS